MSSGNNPQFHPAQNQQQPTHPMYSNQHAPQYNAPPHGQVTGQYSMDPNGMLNNQQWPTPVHSNTEPMPLPMYYPQGVQHNHPARHQPYGSNMQSSYPYNYNNSPYSDKGLNEVHFSEHRRMAEIRQIVYKHQDILDKKDKKKYKK